MIKSIYIDNFKAINSFQIALHPLTVLIGANGSGKSTVLQAIDLVCSFAGLDIHTYLKDRQWTVSDIVSQLGNKKYVTFRSLFELPVNGAAEEIEWEIVLNPVKEKIEPVSEKITSLTHNKTLLKMDSSGFERYNWEKGKIEDFPPLTLPVSLLTTIDIKKDEIKFPSLTVLKKFVLGIDSFQLLSTEKMRRSTREQADSIGVGGEKLTGFIHGLEEAKREKLKTRIKKYLPYIDGIDTKAKGENGWIEMNIAEGFQGMDKPVNVRSMQSSDGMLRMIAISALAEIEKDTGVILLDEIEDGINPYLAANLVADLKEISEEKQRQVIVTTHSSVVLDYFPSGSVVFLWRDKDGAVQNRGLFENEELKASLEYMYPGEVWINMDEEEIVKKLRG